MPRKNRQKLHREQRLRREALNAQNRAQRAARVARHEAPPARAAAPLSLAARVEQHVRLVPHAACFRDARKRLHVLVEAVLRHAPHLDGARLPWLAALLAEVPFEIDPLAGLPYRASWGDLLQALYGRYPIPAFLAEDFEAIETPVYRVPEEHQWKVHVAAALARGESLASMTDTARFPVPLTRRMVHLFLHPRNARSTVHALRIAQVRGRGGQPFLVDALMGSPLAALQPRRGLLSEAWVAELVDWLVRTPDVVARGLADTVRGLVALRAEGVDVQLTGRGYASVRRTALDHLACVAARQVADATPSGFRRVSLMAGAEHVTFEELVSQLQLTEESQAMNNCARMYGRLVRNGAVSLFSMRVGGRRVLTLEVVRVNRTVVQVKGFANRTPTPQEGQLVRRWAAEADLRVLPHVLGA